MKRERHHLMVTMRDVFSACVGIVMLCLALGIDSADCGGEIMSSDQRCITTTINLRQGERYSVTHNYAEQRQYNRVGRFLFGLMGSIFLLAGVGPIIARARRVKKNSDREDIQNKTRRCNDYQYHLEISFLEAIRGATKRLDFLEGSAVEIAVPPGVDNGYTLRIPGRGGPGDGDRKPGDALIEISVKPHPSFARKGLDIWSDVQISKHDALSGATIEVPTPDGYAKVRVPKGTVSGQILRLRGNGIICARSRAIGHQFIRLAVREDAPQPQPADARKNDALETEFKNVFFNRTSADRERIISHWMDVKSVDRAEAMRLAIEEWREDNRRTG